ncbi:MAG: glycosyltransferase [Clostridia bacterium]|nr:glycosyltransferase [Clostridia bacterium]
MGSGIAQNELVKPYTCDLQIIVPAYNVEKYLRSCMDSVLNQKTKYSYKIVLVDDGATDSTPQIADEYANDDRVIVIHQKNRGLSGARNTGLKKIFAKYVMFLDSDDMLCEGAIENLMDCAFKNDADIVEGGMRYIDRTDFTICYEHKNDIINATALGTLHGFACGKIYKAELFQNRQFPEGFWYEDTVVSFLVYHGIEKACCIKDFVYQYRFNPNSITRKSRGNPRSVETYWITELMMREYDELGYSKNELYFTRFFTQAIVNAKRSFALERKVQESIFVLTCELLDKYFDGIKPPKKYKKLYEFMKKRRFWAYRMYCLFV